MEQFMEALSRFSLVVLVAVAILLLFGGVLLLFCPRLLRLALRYVGGIACVATGTGIVGALIVAHWRQKRP